MDREEDRRIGEKSLRDKLVEILTSNLDLNQIPLRIETKTDENEPHRVCDGILEEEESSIDQKIEEQLDIQSKKLVNLLKEDIFLTSASERLQEMHLTSETLLPEIDYENRNKYYYVASKWNKEYNALHVSKRKKAFKILEPSSLNKMEREDYLSKRVITYPKDLKQLSEAQKAEIFEFFPLFRGIEKGDIDQMNDYFHENCELFQNGEENIEIDFEIEKCKCHRALLLYYGKNCPKTWNVLLFAVANNYHEFLKKFSDLLKTNYHLFYLVQFIVKTCSNELIELALSGAPDNESLRVLINTKYIYTLEGIIEILDSNSRNEFWNDVYIEGGEQTVIPSYSKKIFPADYLMSYYHESFLPLCVAHGHKKILVDIFSNPYKNRQQYTEYIKEQVPRILTELLDSNDLELINTFLGHLHEFILFYIKETKNDPKCLFIHTVYTKETGRGYVWKPSRADSFLHVLVRKLKPEMLRIALQIIEEAYNCYRHINEQFSTAPGLDIHGMYNIDLLNPIELAVEVNSEEILEVFKSFGYKVEDHTRLKLYRSLVHGDISAEGILDEICSDPDLPGSMSLLSLLVASQKDELAFKVLKFYERQVLFSQLNALSNRTQYSPKSLQDIDEALVCALYPNRKLYQAAHIRNNVKEEEKRMMCRVGMLLMADANFPTGISINCAARMPEKLHRFVSDVFTKRLTKNHLIKICPPERCYEEMFAHFNLKAADYEE